MKRRHWASLFAAGALALAGLACGDSTAVTVDVARIEIAPNVASALAGGTVPLTARAFDASGAAISAPILRWSSSDVSIATVAATGLVSALSPGTARIAVSSMGRSAVSTLTVLPRPVAALALSPTQTSVIVGRTTNLIAIPRDAAGATLAGRVVTFTSSDVSVATVRSDGTVTGVAPGTATIVATSEGRSAQAIVTVNVPPVQSVTITPGRDTLAVNSTRTFTVQLRDAAGALLVERPVVWSSSSTTVAIVSATGTVAALAPGTATITAASDGRTGTATVVVVERLASAVTVTPASTALTVGRTLALTVQLTDAQGNVLNGRPIAFSSEKPDIATVSATGVVTAVSAGTTRIVVTSEGRTGFATIAVTPIPVADVVVTPATASMTTGESLRLVAATLAADGTPLTGRTVEWRSGAPNVVSVSPSGEVTALAAGTAVVLALSEGVSATATLTVRVPPVTSIVLSPLTPTIDVARTVQLTAVARGPGGDPLNGRAITWRSSNEQVAFVSSTGLVVGSRAGTATITATSEGVSASTIVTVR